jgi:hypothetical protein
MKRLLMLAASIIAAFGLTSCEPEMSRAILGTWEAETMEATVEGMVLTFDLETVGLGMSFTFKDNGTGTATVSEKVESSYTEDSMDFDYTLEDGLLTMDAEGDIVSIPITIDGKKMTMTMDGDLLDEPGTKVKVNFRKK